VASAARSDAASAHARKARPVFKARSAKPARCAALPTSVARRRAAAICCQWSSARQRGPPSAAFFAFETRRRSRALASQVRRAAPARPLRSCERASATMACSFKFSRMFSRHFLKKHQSSPPRKAPHAFFKDE